MRRQLITAVEADDVVDLPEIKTMLGITGTADDAILTALTGAVVGTLDPSLGGWLGRALGPQTWEFRLNGFPYCASIFIPYPPCMSVDAFVYDDAAGEEQTLVEGIDFRILGAEGKNRAEIIPFTGAAWPTSLVGHEAVRLRVQCGYEAGEAPMAIKAAIAVGVRQLRASSERDLTLVREEVPGVMTRQWAVSEGAADVARRAMNSLLSVYQVFE